MHSSNSHNFRLEGSYMQGKLPLAMLFALLASSAFAAGPQPVVAFTFTCNGNPSQRTGACPDGNQPNSLIQGSDGNFYGTTEFSASGEPSSRVRGTVFSVTPAGKFTLRHSFVAAANGSFPNGANPTSL